MQKRKDYSERNKTQGNGVDRYRPSACTRSRSGQLGMQRGVGVVEKSAQEAKTDDQRWASTSFEEPDTRGIKH